MANFESLLLVVFSFSIALQVITILKLNKIDIIEFIEHTEGDDEDDNSTMH